MSERERVNEKERGPSKTRCAGKGARGGDVSYQIPEMGKDQPGKAERTGAIEIGSQFQEGRSDEHPFTGL